MSQEIAVAASISITKEGITVSAAGNKLADMAGGEMISNIQLISQSVVEVIGLGDISTVGYIYVKNLDLANFIELATDDQMVHKFAKILAGDVTLIKSSSSTIYAKADTAAVRIHVVASEL
jgi:hypothetical protein